MGYAADRKDFGSFTDEAPSKTEAPLKRVSTLRRILGAMMEARQREADRQIARLLTSRSAERLTDDLERDIAQRLKTSNWSANASSYGERRFP